MSDRFILTREQFVQAYYDDQLFVLTAHDNALRDKIERLFYELDVARQERDKVFLSTFAVGVDLDP